MPGEKQQTGVSRRTLVKSAALGSLALAAGGVSLPFGMRTAAAAKANLNALAGRKHWTPLAPA